ncbi:MAG: DUF1254 domain-containing protein [Bdellovibrionales bacterium]|nr:DUF1254 domain-containing protein [Bdellovibrionales bacterium]
MNLKRLVALSMAGIALLAFEAVSKARSSKDLSEIKQKAVEAYVYAYPLITMEITRRVMTNVEEPKDARAPMGQFFHAREFLDASNRDVTAPNSDTLYSVAWLDVTKEPYILSIPEATDRYFMFPMLSGWTDVFASPGTRTTGNDAQVYAITGPDWSGQLPAEVKEIKSPTGLVWIIGRTYCSGTQEDYAKVHEFQDGLKLYPLSAWGKDYVPPKGEVDPNIDMLVPPRDQVNNMEGIEFTKLFADLMKTNLPRGVDGEMVSLLQSLGIKVGESFEEIGVQEDILTALQAAPEAGLAEIVGHKQNAGEVVNGWVYNNPTGDYGTDYLQRAFIAYFGLGANLRGDAVYPSAATDSDGNALSGDHKYTLRFEKDQLPPANAFWSVTLYDSEYFFVDNPLNKYRIGSRDDLKMNEDGSVTLYFQKESPGEELESNWLPAPEGKFNLLMRIYWPKEAVLNGEWHAPAILKVD